MNKNNKGKYFSPKDGFINREDVFFLCNRCAPRELVFKNRMYVCPKCLTGEEELFRCAFCGSIEVKAPWQLRGNRRTVSYN